MTRMSGPVLALACAAVSLAALGSLIAPVSSASASTWHHRWSDLSFPAPTNFVQCVPPRSVTLAKRHYRWRTFALHEAHQDDRGHTKLSTVGVAGGLHMWHTCLKPYRYKGRYVYRVTSTLQHQASGVKLYHSALVQRGGWGGGSYHWGATLDRVPPPIVPGTDPRTLRRG
jgi:hypothetical protein